MPIPFLIAAAVAVVAGGAAVGGVAGHMVAKETREAAQEKVDKAKKKHEDAVALLESAQERTQVAVALLMNRKQEICDTSLKKFVDVFNRVKHIVVGDSVGLEELDKFNLDEDSFVQLQNMTTSKNAIVSSIGTTALSLAGTSTVAGVLGVGSIVAFSALAGPALLVTAFLADQEAEKNWEKAKVFESEVDAKVAEMKISRTLCNAIIDKSNMNSTLLNELNIFFVAAIDALDNLTYDKSNGLKKEINTENLTTKDKELIAITRSLAGAVKQVVDTPLLKGDGKLCEDGLNISENVSNSLPEFNDKISNLSIDVSGVGKRLDEGVLNSLSDLKEEIDTLTTDMKSLREELDENISFEILDINKKNADKILVVLSDLDDVANDLLETLERFTRELLNLSEDSIEKTCDRLLSISLDTNSATFATASLSLKLIGLDDSDVKEVLSEIAELNVKVRNICLEIQKLI